MTILQLIWHQGCSFGNWGDVPGDRSEIAGGCRDCLLRDCDVPGDRSGDCRRMPGLRYYAFAESLRAGCYGFAGLGRKMVITGQAKRCFAGPGKTKKIRNQESGIRIRLQESGIRNQASAQRGRPVGVLPRCPPAASSFCPFSAFQAICAYG